MTYNKIAEPAKLFRMMFLIAFIMCIVLYCIVLYCNVIVFLLVYYNITFILVSSLSLRLFSYYAEGIM